VHKIYLTEQSDVAAYDALVAKYKAEDQDQQLTIIPAPAVKAEKADEDVDVKAFRDAWLALQDTHDFHGLLRQHGLTRTQALRLAPDGHAQQISVERLKEILTQASAAALSIMVFTGSAGVIQIHTGEIKQLVQTGPWFNVLDPEFNMHLREDGIAEVWLVKKPTVDGPVHSLEVYDAEGNTIVQFFGKRKPGIPESTDWQNLVNGN
jgi:putative hemin transport protein